MDLVRELEKLHALVDETCDLLDEYGVDFWSRWLRRRAQKLRNDGPAGAGTFASGWGGMGGFNDLIVHPLNGHPIAEADVDTVNRRLEQLRGELYRTAGRVRAGA